MLNKHLFWEEYDQLVLLLLCVVVNFFISEVWSCFTPERNSMMTGFLLFSIGFCLYPFLSLSYSLYSRKVMLSVIIKLGLQSYELRLTLLIGGISFLFTFSFLELPEELMDYSYDLRIGIHISMSLIT